MGFLTLAILGVAALVLGFISWKLWQQLKGLQKRYAGIGNIQAEVLAETGKLEQAKNAWQQFERESQQRRTTLIRELEESQSKREELKKDISLLEENLEDISFGIYKPHFNFKTSEEYKAALEALRDRERQLVRDGRAAVCHTQWTVGNSKTEGARMTKQYTKLMLRAFNGECEAAVANVSWNNIDRMEERVRKSFEALNQLGSVMNMSVTPEFLTRIIHER